MNQERNALCLRSAQCDTALPETGYPMLLFRIQRHCCHNYVYYCGRKLCVIAE